MPKICYNLKILFQVSKTYHTRESAGNDDMRVDLCTYKGHATTS